MKKNVLICFLLLSFQAVAQDTIYARKIIDRLTSQNFYGRGYVKQGGSKAKRFLEREFAAAGLSPMNGNSYIQAFSFPVNTFPRNVNVGLNGMNLIPGKDFIIEPDCKGCKGNFKIHQSDSMHYISGDALVRIKVEDKLTWRVSKTQNDTCEIKILKTSLPGTVKNIILDIKGKYIKGFKTGNICGYVKGTEKPDSFILFSAHYDHLGGMGKETFFPGANDNASGISQLLGLARWYAEHPQKYSIGFICFAGEEAGLLGSEYFVNHPLIHLNKIRFLVNLDLTGTGSEGITVVNATEFQKEFEMMKSINTERDFFKSVNSRGKAKNSDHYWFTEKGVPSFFIYTLGGIKAYHDIYDRSETLPNDHYTQLFQLLTEFVSKLD